MIVKVTNNKDELKKVLFHPKIYWDMSGRNCLEDEFNIPIGENIYIAGYESEIFGVVACERYREGLLLHPYVIPGKRRKAREFFKKSLSMLKCDTYVEFPKDRKHLYNLAKKNGFDSIANNSAKILMKRLKI